MSKPTTTTTHKKQPNYYTTLSLSARKHDPTLTPAEVKAAYKRALLQHHPDKKAASSTPLSPSTPANNKTITIDTIALAYKILSSPSLKAEYDSRLQRTSRSRNNNKPNNSSHGSGFSDSDSDEDEESDIIFRTGLETVDLDDLEFVQDSSKTDDEEAWTRACRCGDDGGFVVTETELEANAEDGEVIVGCRGCSLWLRVLFGVEG